MKELSKFGQDHSKLNSGLELEYEEWQKVCIWW